MGLFGNKKSKDDSGGSAARDVTANAAGTIQDSGGSGSGSAAEGGGTAANPRSQGGRAPSSGGAEVATIGKTIIFKGELSGQEDLLVEGHVEGRISLPDNELTVGAEGRVTAEITAKSIIVTGTTAGNLTASERVEVQQSGVVEGDIRTPRLMIQEGATVNGTIEMSKKPVPSGKTESSEPSVAERKSA